VLFVLYLKGYSLYQDIMDDELNGEYTESFDSFISGSSENVKSVVTELESHDAAIQGQSIDTDCMSPLSTEQQSSRRTALHSSVGRRTSLSTSRSMLRFSRHFSESENYSADFTGSGTDFGPCYSSLESSSGRSKDESDKDLTVCSAGSDSDTDTRTYCSVSEPSIKWKNHDYDAGEFSSDSQHLSSHNSSDVFGYIVFITFAKRLCKRQCLSVCLFVCLSVYE